MPITRLRHHLSFSNVVACLALFVALGGTSYAAITVTGRTVKDRSLTGRDIRARSLTGNHVKDRSLLARDFRAGQLPAGLPGRDGAVGPQGNVGPRGPSDAYEATTEAAVASDKVLSLTLPSGNYAVFARMTAHNESTGRQAPYCALVGESGTASGIDLSFFELEPGSESSLSLQTTIELQSGSPVRMDCTDASFFSSGRLLAIPVTTLHR